MSISVVIPIDNTDNTITRPIVTTVIEQLIYNTEMPTIKDILYIPRGGVAAMGQANDVNEALKLDSDDYLQVEYSEETTDDFDYTKYQFEYPPIFLHRALGIKVTPMHSRVNLELKITYRAKSYNALTTWLNTFRRRLTTALAMHYHDILYNYTVPNDILSYLNQCHVLSETIAGYNIDLHTFIKDHFSKDGVLVRQNLDNSVKAMAINVKNTGVLGLFTELPSVQETSREPPASTLSFTYTVSYDRVTALVMEYQLYIHNQVVDIVYLRKYHDRRFHQNPHSGNRTFTQSVNTVTENPYGIRAYPLNYSNLSDGWSPPSTLPYAITDMYTPVQLDLSNLHDLLDLNLLTRFGYPTWLISLMQSYSSRLCQFKDFPIYIDAFEVNAATGQIPLTIDSNFHLMTPVVLNPRNRYYIRISILTNLLTMDFLQLRLTPELLLDFLNWIYHHLNPDDLTLDTIGDGAYVTTDSLLAALNRINNTALENPTLGLRPVSVNNLIVRTNHALVW